MAIEEKKLEHYSLVKKEKGFKSIWSVFEVNNLYDEFKVSNFKKMLYFDDYINAELSAEIKGSKWIDLYEAADTLINASRDNHHNFIEGFTLEDKETLRLYTGS